MSEESPPLTSQARCSISLMGTVVRGAVRCGAVRGLVDGTLTCPNRKTAFALASSTQVEPRTIG